MSHTYIEICVYRYANTHNHIEKKKKYTYYILDIFPNEFPYSHIRLPVFFSYSIIIYLYKACKTEEYIMK